VGGGCLARRTRSIIRAQRGPYSVDQTPVPPPREGKAESTQVDRGPLSAGPHLSGLPLLVRRDALSVPESEDRQQRKNQARNHHSNASEKGDLTNRPPPISV
jgi:hypothetical protein